MKSKIFYTLILIFISGIVSGCASKNLSATPAVLKKETTSFKNVISTVSLLNDKYLPQNVLVVLDIDNTILTSSVDLGGDIWYQWQREKLELKPNQSQKVDCLFEDSIGLLYELGPMDLTEQTLPETIASWQAAGNTVMALTSRAPKYRAATERELEIKNINFKIKALAPNGEDAPIYREMLGREVSYMKGIMMTSGMNKGRMLTYILNKTNRKFDAIIFVDDSQKNIDLVYAEFKNSGTMDMTIFHYTKIEDNRKTKNGAVLTSEQAIKMDNDWKKLNAVLKDIFPARKLQEGCLSKN